jgi:hypothetical protein
MAWNYRTSLKNSRLQAVIDDIGANGLLKIGTAGMATVLSTIPLASPAFGAPAGGANNVPIAQDVADGAALSSFIVTGQTTVPTFATAGPWLRVAGLPLTLGAGLIWAFGDAGLVVPLSGSMLIANLNASGATLGSFDMYMNWEE